MRHHPFRGGRAHLQPDEKRVIQGKGYIVTPPSYVAVVGAINIDHYGVAMQDVVGEIPTWGALCHPWAHWLQYRLQSEPAWRAELFDFRYGDDENGERVKQDAYANGIDITHAKQISHMPTSTFLSVVSAQGRQIVGLDDMQISAEITPEFLAQREQTIVNAEMVAIDSSLPSDAIAWVCEKTSRPIFVRVVSVNKAARITPVLDRIDTMVLNSAEAKFVSGIEVHDEASARDCAEHLLRSGVRNVFLFVDDSDMLYCCEHESFFWSLPGRAEERRYTNGGASAALSALVWARREHKTQRECARYASAAAAMNMSQVQSICADFSEEAVRRKADLLQ